MEKARALWVARVWPYSIYNFYFMLVGQVAIGRPGETDDQLSGEGGGRECVVWKETVKTIFSQ